MARPSLQRHQKRSAQVNQRARTDSTRPPSNRKRARQAKQQASAERIRQETHYKAPRNPTASEESQKQEGHSVRSRVPVLLQLLGTKAFWTARSVWVLLLLGACFNAGGWVWVVFVIRPTNQQILLHYTVQSGVDAIGPGTDIYVVPLIAAALLLMNGLCAALLFRFERFLSYCMLVLGLVLQLLFFVGALTVTLANS